MNTLTYLFEWVVATSARASALTIVVLMIQAALGHRAPARWRHALWLPVLVVLLMPAFPESSWSVSSIARIGPAPLREVSQINHSAASLAISPIAAGSNTPTPIQWRRIACLVWLTGAAAMTIIGSTAYAQTLWRFKRNRLPMTGGLRRELTALAREIGLRHVPQVWLASAVRGPAVTGLLRPVLLLPAHFEQTLAPHEARLVLKHELMHIKRADLPVNALLCLLLTLHWFNPLLWLAFFKARLDREAACDAQVLDPENQAQRVAYGHTLLKVETTFHHHGLSLGFVGIFQRGPALRARIQSIASAPNEHSLMKTILSFAIALLTFLGITKASTPDPKAPKILIEAKFIDLSGTWRSPKVSPVPLIDDVQKPPSARKAPGLAKILTDPQFQTVIRDLAQRKEVNLFSSPKVTTRAGQEANVEVFSDYAYKDKAGKPATKKCGITLTVLPTKTGGDKLDLEISSQIVEFDRIADHQSGWKEPIFKERKLRKNAVITSAQTAVLEMAPRTDKQTIEDTDLAGHVISSETVHYTTRTLLFVTAYIIDPATGEARIPKAAAAVPSPSPAPKK